jgi:hypothetical protein
MMKTAHEPKKLGDKLKCTREVRVMPRRNDLQTFDMDNCEIPSLSIEDECSKNIAGLSAGDDGKKPINYMLPMSGQRKNPDWEKWSKIEAQKVDHHRYGGLHVSSGVDTSLKTNGRKTDSLKLSSEDIVSTLHNVKESLSEGEQKDLELSEQSIWFENPSQVNPNKGNKNIFSDYVSSKNLKTEFLSHVACAAEQKDLDGTSQKEAIRLCLLNSQQKDVRKLRFTEANQNLAGFRADIKSRITRHTIINPNRNEYKIPIISGDSECKKQSSHKLNCDPRVVLRHLPRSSTTSSAKAERTRKSKSPVSDSCRYLRQRQESDVISFDLPKITPQCDPDWMVLNPNTRCSNPEIMNSKRKEQLRLPQRRSSIEKNQLDYARSIPFSKPNPQHHELPSYRQHVVAPNYTHHRAFEPYYTSFPGVYENTPGYNRLPLRNPEVFPQPFLPVFPFPYPYYVSSLPNYH